MSGAIKRKQYGEYRIYFLAVIILVLSYFLTNNFFDSTNIKSILDKHSDLLAGLDPELFVNVTNFEVGCSVHADIDHDMSILLMVKGLTMPHTVRIEDSVRLTQYHDVIPELIYD